MMRTCVAVVAALVAASPMACGGGGSGSPAPDGSAPADGSMLQEGSAGVDGGLAADASDGSSEAAASFCPFAAPGDAGTCSGVELVGTPVVPTCGGSTAPTGQGGAVESGRYVLQSIEMYPTTAAGCPPASANTGQVVWIVCGEDWATVDRFPGADGGPTSRQYDVIASMDASALALTVACPSPVGAPEVARYEYTATPGHFSLIYGPFTLSSGGLGYSFVEEDDFALQ